MRSGSRVTVAPSSASWRPGQELRRRVDDDVGALVERAQVDGRRRRSRRRRRGPGGPAAPPSRARERRVCRRLDPDDVGVGRRRRSGRTRRSGCPSARARGRAPRCRSRRPRRARSSCPGRAKASTTAVAGGRPGGVEERVAALELARAAPRPLRRSGARSGRRRTRAARRARRRARSSSGRPVSIAGESSRCRVRRPAPVRSTARRRAAQDARRGAGVVEPGDPRQRRRRRAAATRRRCGSRRLPAANPPTAGRDRLRPRLQLAEVARRDHDATLERGEPQAADQQLARDDRRDHPGREDALIEQDDERRRARAPCRRPGRAASRTSSCVPMRRAIRPSNQSVDIATQKTPVAQ